MANGNGEPKRGDPHLALILTCPQCGATSNLAMENSLEIIERVVEHLRRGECVAIHSGQAEVLGRTKGQ
jgi:hypothetical protein